MRPEVLDHHFLVAEHFVDMHRNALRGAAHHDDGVGPDRGRLFAAGRYIQQSAGPEKRQLLAGKAVALAGVGGSQIGSARTLHQFDQVGWHADRQGAGAQHDHVRDRRRQGQHQPESRSLAGRAAGFYAPTQGIDLDAHHVHSDAATDQFGHLQRR